MAEPRALTSSVPSSSATPCSKSPIRPSSPFPTGKCFGRAACPRAHRVAAHRPVVGFQPRGKPPAVTLNVGDTYADLRATGGRATHLYIECAGTLTALSAGFPAATWFLAPLVDTAQGLRKTGSEPLSDRDSKTPLSLVLSRPPRELFFGNLCKSHSHSRARHKAA